MKLRGYCYGRRQCFGFKEMYDSHVDWNAVTNPSRPLTNGITRFKFCSISLSASWIRYTYCCCCIFPNITEENYENWLTADKLITTMKGQTRQDDNSINTKNFHTHWLLQQPDIPLCHVYMVQSHCTVCNVYTSSHTALCVMCTEAAENT